MRIVDRVGLSGSEHERLAEIVSTQTSLDRVIGWALRCEPPRLVADVVIQDEYTHDVIVPYEGGRYLVYDST
jgi:hypothetical protein